MKRNALFHKPKWLQLRWLGLVLVLAITATTVMAATSPYALNSFWMADPLFSGIPGDPTNAQPGDTVPGYWYRDTTNQNALAQYTADQFTDEIKTLYTSDTLNVYEYVSARGPNITLLTTARNYFIVGCGGGTNEATYAKSRLGSLWAGKTLLGIVLTSVSADDLYGCNVWTKGQNYAIVYASSDFLKALQRNPYLVEDELETRSQMFHGTFLPWGTDSLLGAGTMGEYRAVPPQNFKGPNILVSSQMDIILDGNTITLIPTFKEDSGLMVKIPAANIITLGEFFGHSLPDPGTIYGYGISPHSVIGFLDTLGDLSPNILMYKSGQPIFGSAEVQTAILAQRDALQYLHNLTIDKINQGYTVDEIVATTRLPDTRADGTPLGTSPYNQEYASDQASIIRWIYNYYLGWFSGEPVELTYTLTETMRAQILADAYGGVDALTEAAQQAELAASDQASAEKALYLAYSAYKLSPDEFEVKQIYAQVLRKIAFMQKSAYKRNYYLATAQGLGTEQMVSDISKTGQEDTALAFTALEFSQHFAGIGGASLTSVKIDSLPDANSGVLTLPGTDESGNPILVPVTIGQEIPVADLDGLVFTPAADWNGSNSFLWNGKDGSGYAATDASVRITLDPVNDSPVVSSTPLAGVTVDEDAAPSAIDLSTGFTDVDIAINGDVLTYTATSSSEVISLSLDGANLTLSFPSNWNGLATISVTSADAAGASVTDDFTVTANPVNDAPTAADATITVVAGKSQTITLDYGDLETAQTNLQVTFGSLNVTLNASALPGLTYTAPATAGDDSFTYTITDRGDPDACTSSPCAASQSVTATVHVTVLAAPSGSIAGTVFNDANANGTLEAGEGGLAGVIVQLQDANGNQLETFTIAADGAYTFTGLEAGSYLVYAPKDANRVQTTVNPIAVTLAEAQAATGVDIGSVVSSDLKVSMTYSVNNKKIIFAITVTNDGPADALNAVVTDMLPDSVAYISVISTQGTCSGGKTVNCSFGTIASGGNVTVTIQVNRVNIKVAVDNTATVSSSIFDIDLADNLATVRIP